MLTKEDLGQIRDVVNTAITDVVPGIVHDVVQPMFIASEKRIIAAVAEMLDDNILPQLDTIYEDIHVLKEDVGVLKQDVSVLKQDMTVLKQDVAMLKEDVSELKEDMTEVKQDIRGINAKMITKGGLEDRLVDFRLSFANAARS